MNETELVKEAKTGNVHSFEQLIYKYDKKILGIIIAMVGSKEDAMDLYQEVFLKVYKSLNKFRQDSNFYTWIYRITVNVCLNYRKKRQTNRIFINIDNGIDDDENSAPVQFEAPEKTPDKKIEEKELKKIVKDAVDTLPEKQRMVFYLKHYQEKKISEIAEIMGCSEGTVKNYLFRASEKLKKALKDLRTYTYE